jgi:hypothetical protein
MIDVREHVYQDNPKVGHSDVRTKLKDVSYFFIGNGWIQGAVQIAPAGEGTPVGLLVMNPEHLRKKREALTMDPDTGLENTMIRVFEGPEVHQPSAGAVEAFWSETHHVPSVCVRWQGRGLRVEEHFFCPEKDTPFILRKVRIKSRSRRRKRLRVQTGAGTNILTKKLLLQAYGEKSLSICYFLAAGKPGVLVDFGQRSVPGRDLVDFWEKKSSISFGHPLLDRFFRASRFQLPAVISRTGRVDGGVWQYNREWLRDQAMLALALTMTGDRGMARTMFSRLFDKFVTPDGDTIDSSEKRDPDEVELDQNGFLLYAFKDYVLWTGDLGTAKEKWDKIVVTAEFPLKDSFRHPPSGLLTNRREFWERHCAHGIQSGIELVHQLYTSVGLRAAAVLARMLGRAKEAGRWESEAARIKRSMLEDPKFRMWDDRGFIKRRGLAGQAQETVRALPDSGLPSEAPLAGSGDHFLNPDTSSALPIAIGFVPPGSPLCRMTLAWLETLWNQAWKGGGYGRYHSSSEPDSAGAWPFPSLFVARACIETGDFNKVWRILHWLDTVPGAKAGSWFEFYGKRLAPPFPQVGIVPWNWAELIILFVHHILGVQPQEHALRIRPRLLPGLKRVRASFPFRGSRLELDFEKTEMVRHARFRTNGEVLESDAGQALIAYRWQNLWLKARLPLTTPRSDHDNLIS